MNLDIGQIWRNQYSLRSYRLLNIQNHQCEVEVLYQGNVVGTQILWIKEIYNECELIFDPDRPKDKEPDIKNILERIL